LKHIQLKLESRRSTSTTPRERKWLKIITTGAAIAEDLHHQSAILLSEAIGIKGKQQAVCGG
jgi:hypothetical protein